MRIRFNSKANKANRLHRQNIRRKSKSAGKLASGFRINRAADDAAGLSISQRMIAQKRGLQQNQRNLQDGRSLLDVADQAMGEMQENAQRMRELAIQGANDTLVESDRKEIKKEMRQAQNEMENIAQETEFNNMPLLDGTFSKKTEDVSDENDQPLDVPDDGTPASRFLELGGFDVEFEFEKLSNDEVQVKLKHEEQTFTTQVIENEPIEWEETAGGSEVDIGSDIVKTDDGGYISVGKTSSLDEDSVSNSTDNDNIFAVKFDAQGEIEWSETYEDTNKAEGASITDDGDGYLISATAGTNAGDSDIMLLKIDDDGDEVFNHTYGGQNDFGRSIHNIDGGGKILAGNVNARHGNNDMMLIKLDENDDFKWRKQIENEDDNDSVYDVKSIDDGFLVAGRSGGRAVLHKVDNDGNLVDTVKSHSGKIREVQQLDDGSIVTVGYNSLGNSVEVRKFDDDLELQRQQSTSTGSVDEGMGVEIVDNNGTEEIVISATTTASDGSQEASAIRLDSDLDTIWKTFKDDDSKEDFGSHGNKGDQIHSTTDGGYLTAGLDNRIVQFNEEGIFDWELDFEEIEGGDYEDYNIENIVAGEDSYFVLLNDGDNLQMAKVNSSGNLDDTNNLGNISDQDFQRTHLLAGGEDGFVVETIDDDGETYLHGADWSEKVAEEYESISSVISNDDGLALVGKSERGDVNISVGLDDDIYNGLTVDFTNNASVGNETVVYDHGDNELTVDLDNGENYTTAEIEEIVNDAFESEDVITYYDAADLNDLVDEMAEDYTDDASLDYLDFFVDGADLSSFDLDDLNLELTGKNEETAIAEVDVNGTTIRVEGNTAFREDDTISISDSNGIDETINFNTSGADWSVNPDNNDDVMSQTERIEEIIDNYLTDHSAEIIGDGNQLRITEDEGQANGENIDISATEGYLEFEELEGSVEEVRGVYDFEIKSQGKYNFEIEENFAEGEILEFAGEEFIFGQDGTGDQIRVEIAGTKEGTADNLADEINDLADWDSSTDGAKIDLEATVDMTGEVPSLSINSTDDQISKLEEENFVEGDELEFAGETFTFRDEATQDFEVEIGANHLQTAQNLADAIEELDRWGSADVDDATISITETENEATGDELNDINLELTSDDGDISNLNEERESVAEVQGEYELTIGNNEVFYDKEINLNVEEELEPDDESAELDADENLNISLAQDIELDQFSINSDVAFESSGEKWEDGDKIVLNTEDNEASGSELYLNSLSNLWLAELDGNGNLESEEVFGGSGVDEGSLIVGRDDGGYITVGQTSSQDGDLDEVDGVDANDEEKTWIKIINQDDEIEEQLVDSDLPELTDIRVDGDDFILFGKTEDDNPVAYSLAEDNGDWEIEELGTANVELTSEFSISETEDGYQITGTDEDGDLHLIDTDDFTENDLSDYSSEAAAIATDDQNVFLATNKELLSGKDNGVVRKVDEEGDLIWETEIDEDEEVNIEDIQTTSDDTLIVTGMLKNESSDDRMVIYELDQAGENPQQLGDYSGLSSLSIDEADDGDYIITGHREMQNQDELYQDPNANLARDMSVLKVDSDNGDVQWRKDYGADNESVGNAFPTSDGGYLMTGTVTSYTNPKYDDGDYEADKDAVVIKVDEDGDWEWDLEIGADDLDAEGVYIHESSNGYIMTASQENENDENDLLVTRIDNNGNITSQETFGEDGDVTVGNIATTNDGGYILTGSKDDNLWVKKLDNNLNENWEKTYGGSGEDRGSYVEQTSDGGYIITGSSKSNNLPDNLDEELQGDEDLLILRLDEDGEREWADLIGGSGDDAGETIREIEDGRYILTGSTTSSDGDVESQPTDNSEEAMWAVEYSQSFQREIFNPEETIEKVAPIGTGEIFLEIDEARVVFDWDSSDVLEIEAEGVQRTDAKFGVQAGPNSDQKPLTRIDNVSTEELGFAEGWLDGDFSDEDFVDETLNTIDGAIEKLSSARSQVGAFSNRIDHALNNVENYHENISDANSRIRDVDMAQQMMEHAKMEIIEQATTAMMAQANTQPETILQLLE